MDATPGQGIDAGPGPAPGRGWPSAASLIGALAIAGAVGWSYRASFAYLARFWGDSNYSHGWLIGPIALAILRQRRGSFPRPGPSPRWWAVLPLAVLMASRYWLYERNEQWAEAATIPLAVASIVLAVLGGRVLLWALPALIYLFFMIPLPPSLNTLMAGPLQTLATRGSVALIQATGTPVVDEGNVISIGTQRLEVAEACRGLSMLLSFAALIAAMVILVRRPIWERVVLVLSTVPIALLCNIARIATTAVVYSKTGRPIELVHDWAGMAMMGLALLLVLLELKIMAWLVVEEAATDGPPTLLRASYGPNPGPR